MISDRIIVLSRGLRIAFIGLACFLLLGLSGCSKNFLIAKFYLEKAFGKIRQLSEPKFKKSPYAVKKKQYYEACQDFLKAYHLDPNAFWLSEIEEAERACFMAEEKISADLFTEVREDYMKKHPKETEYGFLASDVQ